MALVKKSTQGKVAISSLPEKISVSIPDWYRDKYPEVGKAFDTLAEQNSRILDELERVNNRLRTLENA